MDIDDKNRKKKINLLCVFACMRAKRLQDKREAEDARRAAQAAKEQEVSAEEEEEEEEEVLKKKN